MTRHSPRLQHPAVYDGGTLAVADNLDQRSADSEFMLTYWQKVQAIVDGSDKIRECNVTYLPKFPNEEQADYDFRLANSKFTNIYRDVIEGLTSKPFEREVQLPEGVDPDIVKYCEDVDGSKNNLTVFAIDMFFNGVNAAIDWIFVDYSGAPVDPLQPRTRQQEKALGVRPFWTHVAAINVLEVRSAIVSGVEQLTYIRIFEPGPDDQVRIMRNEGGSAVWELWERSKERKNSWTMIGNGIITIGVIPMVPFVTGRRMGRSWRFHPMMQDAADLQIQLYNDESGLNNIKRLTAYPMLAGQGVDPPKLADGKPATLRAGPGATVFTGRNTDGSTSGHFEWLTPDASLLSFLAADVKATSEQLRELGRQPLTAQSGNLTVISAGAAAAKANSAVGMWALGAKDALENALVLTAKWMRKPDTIKIEVDVFNDFEVAGEGGEALSALATARTARDISGKTYTDELKRRNVLSAEFDYEEDQKELLKEVPADDGIDSDVDPVDK